MKAHQSQTALIAACVIVSCSLLLAAPEIRQQSDGGVEVTAKNYTASIAADGNLTELKIAGEPSLSQTWPADLQKEKASVRIIGNIVAVRRGPGRVEWTFNDDEIAVVTDGFLFEMGLDPQSLLSVLNAAHQGGPLTSARGGSMVILNSEKMIEASEPFHFTPVKTGLIRVTPTAYVISQKKSGDLLEFRLKIGMSAEKAQLLSGVTVDPVTADYGALHEGGNRGYGLIHFPDPSKIIFKTSQFNLSGNDVSVDYFLTVEDHYAAAHMVDEQNKTNLTLPPHAKTELEWTLPTLKPGFYYMKVSVRIDGRELTNTKTIFTVDLPHYDRPLTRPADFEEFWKRQDERLKATDPKPEVALISSPQNPNKAYEVTLQMPEGLAPVKGILIVPENATGPAIITATISPMEKLRPEFENPDWKPKGMGVVGSGVIFQTIFPEQATFTRWDSANDNNLLECILVEMRSIDFLASRPEADPRRIKLFGASRGGPVVVVAAARRPENVCAVDGHVHTSAGLSWTDKPYRGWGVPRGYNPGDPEKVAQLAAMAAYVDPVNHAPDLRAPIIFAWGDMDDLSPPQGIEAMYQHTGSKWKRIARDRGGHQYSPAFQQLEKDLNAEIGSTGSGKADTSILREH